MKKNIRKVKKFQKTLICLIGILGFVLGVTVEKIMKANADEINYEYVSDNIDYDNSTSNLNATNVKDAIDELYAKVGQCPKGYNCLTNEEFIATGSKFLRAYTYDESVCVTGNETGCVIATCIEDDTTCPVGTIIDYFVNNATVVRFHVLHDNGTTLTMQSQKNTVYSTVWQASGDHRDGPVTIMAELNRVTNGWSNVKDITLADGMIQFDDGISPDNKCTATTCSPADENYGYSYSKLVNNASIGSTIKARMITITETASLGCTTIEKSCPIYLYNYLSNSYHNCRVSGKCTNDITSNNYGYWTMSAHLSANHAWRVNYYGRVNNYDTTVTDCGARAVVVVNK